MRIERLVSLELGSAPGQGAAGSGAPVRGKLSLGDRPDWTLDVSVRRAIEPFGDELLARAEALLKRPVAGLAEIVDLGRVGVEAYVAYRWVDGRTLAALLGGGLARAELERIVGAVREVLARAAASLPIEHGAPAQLALEQIYVLADRGVVVTDWLGGGRPEGKLDPAALSAALLARASAALRADPENEPTAPKPKARVVGFDAALGAALAGDEDPVAPDAPRNPLHTQALPQSAWRAIDPAAAPARVGDTAPEQAAATLVDTPQLAEPPPSGAQPAAAADSRATPPVRRGTPAWLLGGVVGMLAVGGGVLVQRLTHPPPIVRPPAAIPATPTPAPTPTPVPAPTPELPAPSAPSEPTAAEPARPHPRPHADASIAVRSDVAAGVYVDGKLVGETPLSRLALSPGRHVVRLEALEGAMRLLPREETVTLAAGERRTLTIELK